METRKAKTMVKTISRKALMKKLGNFISVSNTDSRNGMSKAPNQFELTFENGKAFQSYESLIGVYMNGAYYFTANHTYSNTTSGHCTRWCGYNAAERRKGIANGTFYFVKD